MDAISLPLVTMQTRLDVAVTELKSAGRSGLVVDTPNGYRLYSAATIVRGVRANLIEIADLAGPNDESEPVHAVNLSSLAAKGVKVLGIDSLVNTLGGPFSYGLLAAGPAQGRSRALIITLNETLRVRLEPSIDDCYCAVERNCIWIIAFLQ